MNVLEKVTRLGAAAKYDNCASSASNRKVKTNDRIGNAAGCGICHTFTQDGRCISLYKTLFSNLCTHDCKYCQNSSGCKNKKATFKAEELAKVFMSLYVRNYVEGLFLSSAVIKDADNTTEMMLDAIELIRTKYKFQGYIHFKVLPGTSYDHVKRASEISDRMSVNIEVPNSSRLSEISSTKDYKNDILKRQAWMKRMKMPSGQTTQLVVGSTDETDLEILNMINWEYENIKLKRAYYSAFIPVQDTPLQNKRSVSLLREHRLYNVDFMMRKYHIRFREFKDIMDNDMLPRSDPKISIAEQYFDNAVDLNEAAWEDLIRVPGIGPLSAHRILELQKSGIKLSKKEQLKNIGVVIKRALPFIKIDGYHQKTICNFA